MPSRALSSSAAASEPTSSTRSTRSRYAPTKWISLDVCASAKRAPTACDSANRADSHTCLKSSDAPSAARRNGPPMRREPLAPTETCAPRAPPGRRRFSATRTAARALSAARRRRPSSGRRDALRLVETPEVPPSTCVVWFKRDRVHAEKRRRAETRDFGHGRVCGVGVAASASASALRRRRRRRRCGGVALAPRAAVK